MRQLDCDAAAGEESTLNISGTCLIPSMEGVASATYVSPVICNSLILLTKSNQDTRIPVSSARISNVMITFKLYDPSRHSRCRPKGGGGYLLGMHVKWGFLSGGYNLGM